MQHRSEHALKGTPVIEQDGVRVQSYRTFPFAQEDGGAPCGATGRGPVWQPADTDVAAKPTAEEDGVEVAEGFDDKIRSPGATTPGSYCFGKALNGFRFQFPWLSAQVVVFEYVPACLSWGNERSVVRLCEPLSPTRVAVSMVILWVFLSS